ncbi:MAG: glycerate kinase, partial [Sphingobacterium sp.]
VYLNARMEKGAQYFCEVTGFHQALAQADLLITGEGSIDHQSLAGKAPIVVAGLARDRNLPVLGLAGKIPRTISDDLQQYFSMLLSIGNQPEELDLALSHTAENLTRTAKQIASLLMALQN